MYVEMMDVIRSRESLHLINNIQTGNGLGKEMQSYINDLKRRAQQTDGEHMEVTVEGLGLPDATWGKAAFSTDESYISEDDWYGDGGEDE